MITNIRELSQTQKAALEAMSAHSQSARVKANSAATAQVLVAAAGADSAEAFFKSKVAPLALGECRFFGPDGVEASRLTAAAPEAVGFAFDSLNGATAAMKVRTGTGEDVVVQFDAPTAALMVKALVEYLNLTREHAYEVLGYDGANEYEQLLADLAEDHLSLSGARAKAYRDARAEAELTVRAHATAAEEKAMEVAERRVEGIIRKLSQAAAMPAGLERSILLEEAQPLIRKAFGGGDGQRD